MSNIPTGFFDMGDVSHIISNCKNITDAKLYLNSKVDAFVEKHPLTEKENINKAKLVIDRSKNTKSLAIAISNFILAHPSEKLKVL